MISNPHIISTRLSLPSLLYLLLLSPPLPPIHKQLSLSTFDKNVMRNWRKARKLQRKNRQAYARSASLLDNTEEDEDTHEEEGEEVITTMLPPSHQSAKQEKKKSRLLSLLAKEKIRTRRVKSSRSKSVYLE